MHATCEHVLLGAPAELLLAANLQRSLRNPDRLADLRDVQRLIGVFLYQPVKSSHDALVAPLRGALLRGASCSEAAYHRLNEDLFQSTRRLGMSDDLRGGFCKVTSRGVQPLEPYHRGCLRGNNLHGIVNLTSYRRV